MYYTLIKTNGEIIRYKRQPSVEKVRELLECTIIESNLFGMLYNGKEYNIELITDDEFVISNKPINTIISEAMNKSLHWRNRSFIESNNTDIVICGNVLVITEQEL